MNAYFNSLKRIADNVPNVNVNINSNRKMATVSYGPGTFVTTTFKPDTKSVHINYGRTHQNIRRKGVGTMLRALITLAAKNAKVNKVTQRSVHTKNTKNIEKPPSYYIMKKLGYNQISPINFAYNTSKNNKNMLYSFISKFS
jgi:hypothetical protein